MTAPRLPPCSRYDRSNTSPKKFLLSPTNSCCHSFRPTCLNPVLRNTVSYEPLVPGFASTLVHYPTPGYQLAGSPHVRDMITPSSCPKIRHLSNIYALFFGKRLNPVLSQAVSYDGVTWAPGSTHVYYQTPEYERAGSLCVRHMITPSLQNLWPDMLHFRVIFLEKVWPRWSCQAVTYKAVTWAFGSARVYYQTPEYKLAGSPHVRDKIHSKFAKSVTW